jgi:hypothetical protein
MEVTPASLQDRLNAMKANSEARIPAEAPAVMHRATGELKKSGILDRTPKVGDRAPDFSLHSTQGTRLESRALLESGPMVPTFYRGGC